MNWIGYFIIGLFIGGSVGAFTMAILYVGSKADDELLQEKQYDETD